MLTRVYRTLSFHTLYADPADLPCIFFCETSQQLLQVGGEEASMVKSTQEPSISYMLELCASTDPSISYS